MGSQSQTQLHYWTRKHSNRVLDRMLSELNFWISNFCCFYEELCVVHLLKTADWYSLWVYPFKFLWVYLGQDSSQDFIQQICISIFMIKALIRDLLSEMRAGNSRGRFVLMVRDQIYWTAFDIDFQKVKYLITSERSLHQSKDGHLYIFSQNSGLSLQNLIFENIGDPSYAYLYPLSKHICVMSPSMYVRS